jgi:hypothetical protein
MLKMYDEQINAANNYSQMAKSWMPPTLSTGPWQTPYKNFNEGMWMITGEQMIPNPSKRKANYNYMTGMAAVEQQDKSAKRNEMFAIAKHNYYEWVALKKKYNVLMQTDTLLNTWWRPLSYDTNITRKSSAIFTKLRLTSLSYAIWKPCCSAK